MLPWPPHLHLQQSKFLALEARSGSFHSPHRTSSPNPFTRPSFSHSPPQPCLSLPLPFPSSPSLPDLAHSNCSAEASPSLACLLSFTCLLHDNYNSGGSFSCPSHYPVSTAWGRGDPQVFPQRSSLCYWKRPGPWPRSNERRFPSPKKAPLPMDPLAGI